MPAQSRREVDGAEDDQPRRRRNHIHEEVPTQLRPLRPHELLGVLQSNRIALRRPERAGRLAVGAHEQLRPKALAGHHRDERRPATALREVLEVRLQAHGS